MGYPDVYDHLLGNALVPNDPKVKWLLRNVPKDSPDYPELIKEILKRRARWRTRQTLWQREWQTKTSRRPKRNRHSDSVTIREQYVRC